MDPSFNFSLHIGRLTVWQLVMNRQMHVKNQCLFLSAILRKMMSASYFDMLFKQSNS